MVMQKNKVLSKYIKVGQKSEMDKNSMNNIQSLKYFIDLHLFLSVHSYKKEQP